MNKLVGELRYERAQINELMRQTETVNSAVNDSQFLVQQRYNTYVVYFFVVLLLILLFLRFGS
jgi:hypothetical protein